MTSSPVFDSQDAYAVQTLARHQAIRRMLSEVSMDIQVCRLEDWNPYEFITMLEAELAWIRQQLDKARRETMAETNRRCPFCGAVGEVETGSDGYRIRCKNCHAAMGQWWETKAQAAKWWNHRATDGQACSGCTWYRISEAFNWCELVHQKRDATDYCSKWRKA